MATATKPLPPLLPPSSRLATTANSPPKWVSFEPGLNSRLPSVNSMAARRRRMEVSTSVAFNPSGNFDLSLLEEEEQDSPNVTPPMPPSDGRYEVVIDNDAILRLDLSPFQLVTGITSASSVDPKVYLERTIGFTINYTREDPRDPRELSEFPEIRLWFVRLDASYPWLPLLLDWRAGELARYAAMLVPHQMNMKMGIVFNPEALELFVMNKVMVSYAWLKVNGVPKPRIKPSDMARMLGFAIGDELFNLIDTHPLEGGTITSSESRG
ncbi:hypothetical protein MLD38_014857 [Melastoma candidum]|uniref:Uncharacterized protein n=1 Tax=Melastoma candidum TaxID=119954 RepID=A0ACB9RE61_9MYRT|nr:hypothetical protein MLD38_014857 [Melastoma candidum]